MGRRIPGAGHRLSVVGQPPGALPTVKCPCIVTRRKPAEGHSVFGFITVGFEQRKNCAFTVTKGPKWTRWVRHRFLQIIQILRPPLSSVIDFLHLGSQHD